MSKKVTLPSNVKTAYGLLSYIRKLILEEPLRYDQRNLLSIEGKTSPFTYGAPATYPACGTVGCVAGWTAVLLNPARVYRINTARVYRINNVWNYARKHLGLTTNQSNELFSSYAAGYRESAPSQSSHHAKNGAAHIAEFQAKYRRQLQSTPIR